MTKQLILTSDASSYEAIRPQLDELLSAIAELIDGSDGGDTHIETLTFTDGIDGTTLRVEYIDD